MLILTLRQEKPVPYYVESLGLPILDGNTSKHLEGQESSHRAGQWESDPDSRYWGLDLDLLWEQEPQATVVITGNQ